METKCNHLSVKILSHTEKIMRLYYDMIIRALMANKLENPENDVGEIRNSIVPFKMQLTSMLYDIKPFEKVEFDQKMVKLRLSLYGENRYQYLRPKAFIFEAYHSASSMHSSLKIDREQIKEMNRLKRNRKKAAIF